MHSDSWIGFDLDGTIARYDGWLGVDHIGEPIPGMIELIKRYLDEGYRVKILTARVAGADFMAAQDAIWAWCEKHIGVVLPVTCAKDFSMIKFYDDRCIQMIPNTGKRADGEPL